MAKYPFHMELARKSGAKSTRRGVPDGTSRTEVDNMILHMVQMQRDKAAAAARLCKAKHKKTGMSPARIRFNMRQVIRTHMKQVEMMTFAPLEVMTYVMAMRLSQGKLELALKAAAMLAPFTNSKAPTELISNVTEHRIDANVLDEKLERLTNDLSYFQLPEENQ